MEHERCLPWRRAATSRAGLRVQPLVPTVVKVEPKPGAGEKQRWQPQEGLCVDSRSRPEAPVPSHAPCPSCHSLSLTDEAVSPADGGPLLVALRVGVLVLSRAPFRPSCWPSALCGHTTLQATRLQGGGAFCQGFRGRGQPALSPPGIFRSLVNTGREGPRYECLVLPTGTLQGPRICARTRGLLAGVGAVSRGSPRRRQAQIPPGRGQPLPCRRPSGRPCDRTAGRPSSWLVRRSHRNGPCSFEMVLHQHSRYRTHVLMSRSQGPRCSPMR